MTTAITRYDIPVTDEVITLALPEGYMFCDIQNLGGQIYMWCMVDSDATLANQYFRIVGTGDDLEGINIVQYLKTLTLPDTTEGHIFRVNGP